MKLMKRFLPIVLLATPGLIGCTDEAKKIDEPVAATTDDKHDFTVDKDGKVKFNLEIVYFNFDDHSLTEEGMARLNRLAEHMKSSKDAKLKIEGHCDERGSTEYNLALGQLRAQAVRAYLLSLNMSEERIESVSFGEERPAIEGRGEDNWAKNRRAEFTFVN
jgi:peptidoglycan-associated lipoprotein